MHVWTLKRYGLFCTYVEQWTSAINTKKLHWDLLHKNKGISGHIFGRGKQTPGLRRSLQSPKYNKGQQQTLLTVFVNLRVLKEVKASLQRRHDVLRVLLLVVKQIVNNRLRRRLKPESIPVLVERWIQSPECLHTITICWLHTEISVRHRELNPDTVAHLSTNWTQCRLTSLIEANALTTTLDHQVICYFSILVPVRIINVIF